MTQKGNMMQLYKMSTCACNPGLETKPIQIRRQPRCLVDRKKLQNLMTNILKYCFSIHVHSSWQYFYMS